MKSSRYTICFYLIATLGILTMITGCDKNDSRMDYGYTKIYMPQAALANLNVLVPSGRDSATNNYTIDATRVNVLLGVSRSGKADAGSYSVGVTVRADTIAQMITAGTIKVDPDRTKDVVLLPADAYNLVQSVSVPDGQTSAPFAVSIDKAKLRTYAGKKVALAVELTNPSNYSLNKALNKVVIIINVDALKLS